MNYGLNDHAVKRIAAVAYHKKGGSMLGNISNIYHTINTPETLDTIAQAHTTDAMQHKFPHRDAENIFKSHLAKAHAINRGTLEPSPISTGSEQV